MIAPIFLGYQLKRIKYKIAKGAIHMIGKIIEERRKRAERDKKIKTAKNIAAGTIIGTAIGTVAGVLFAPKSGEETREDIANRSKEVAENIKFTVNDKMEATKEWTEKVASDIKSSLGDIKENIDEMKEKREVIVEDSEGVEKTGELIGEGTDIIEIEMKEE